MKSSVGKPIKKNNNDLVIQLKKKIDITSKKIKIIIKDRIKLSNNLKFWVLLLENIEYITTNDKPAIKGRKYIIKLCIIKKAIKITAG